MVDFLPAGWPWYHPLKLLRALVVAGVTMAVLGYIVVCVYLFSIQNSLTYPRVQLPAAAANRTALALGLVPWAQTTPGAEAPQGYVRPDFAQPAPRGTIVVFHGNAGFAYERTEYVEAFSRRGFRTFLYEYPGYGARPGRPSEAVIVPDGRAVVRALDQAGYGPVYVWGESLGAGVAAAVCGEAMLPVRGLVLLTPWDTIANVGLSMYPYIPVRQLMIDRYDSVANLEHFGHPVCVVRSDRDEVIPPPLSLNLFERLPEPKKMIVLPEGGHNAWPRTPELAWWDEALDFVAPGR